MKTTTDLKLLTVCPMCDSKNTGYEIRSKMLRVTCKYCGRPYKIPRALFGRFVKSVRNDFTVSKSIVLENLKSY